MPLNVKWRNAGQWGMIGAIIVNFVICGLWHGANWTFVLWGFYHGLLFIPLILSGKMFKKTKIGIWKYNLPNFKTFGGMLLTFLLVTLGLVVFHSDTIGQAFDYLAHIASASLFSMPLYRKILLLPALLILIEWKQRDKEFALQIDGIKSFAVRLLIYYVLIFSVILFSVTDANKFIYFQF
jgi:D-alanyl-lipoteichoic acid acyltransferase DltB (MBOAT superfamily)